MNFATSILTALIFFFLGYWSAKSKDMIEDLKETGSEAINGVRAIKRGVKVLTTPTIPTGAIKHPTPEQIAFRSRPLKEREGIEEMRKTLDDMPDIQEHKRRVEYARKAGLL